MRRNVTVRWSPWWARRVSARAVLTREVTALAAARGIEVFTSYCESHTTQVPFHAVARLLRDVTGCAVWTIRAPAPNSGREIPALIPTTCCCSRICWASPTPMWSCRGSMPRLGAGG